MIGPRKDLGMEIVPGLVDEEETRHSASGVVLRALIERRQPLTTDQLSAYAKEVDAVPLDMSIDDGIMILIDGGIARATPLAYNTVELTPDFLDDQPRT